MKVKAISSIIGLHFEEAERLMKKGREEGVKIGLEKGRAEGKKVGLKEGQELGAVQKAIQMAKVLKKKGVDVKLIAVASGLSIKQIQKL